MLSHINIVSNILMLNSTEGQNLSWNNGLVCLMHLSMYIGFTLVAIPKFELNKFCSYVPTMKIAIAFIVPPVLLLLGKHPIVENYALSSLQILSSGAAPLTRDLVDTVCQRIGVPVKQVHSLSETSPATHNITAKYMSSDEKAVPVGQTDELWLKGPNVFLGYLNNPAGAKNALTEDSYFRAGDVGHKDKNGDFYITDRIKELIKYKGFQVAPAELEGLLHGHHGIDDVAVIGVYDKARARGSKTTLETGTSIIQWFSARVAAHKRLGGGVRFVDVVPKNAAGKILRRTLVDKAKQEAETIQSKL
ncbi:uncharacterized protein FOBCDRAFT_241513 [Fusarium oxysporum Fo47]|uniref:uncharacterized protein n=1 Tax=Fusarium oxysporum Fo47 TaxID=660027 RepID=UPI002869E260|nr:uncharacterized protein FOBCDRAFT_241513 [Fusarium oxysporum Fo47]WJG35639.1 hypothetical protein FOBCDRAFT_241513 [Fusarium oxysporum Fo47]